MDGRHATNRDLPSAELRMLLLDWFDRNKRDLPWRRSGDPYAIWVSEVMLQQTQVSIATVYFPKFLQMFPDVRSLARADAQDVLKAWEGMGYYSRARHLHRSAQIIDTDFGGKLPAHWHVLRRLPGFGDYTTAAVLSIAFGLPYAVVDGNVKRVLARLLLIEAPVNSAPAKTLFQRAADQLLDRLRPGDYNQALMELGALVCTPRAPQCMQCPLSMLCKAVSQEVVGHLPNRLPRAPVPLKRLVACVVRRNGRILIVRRPSRGLLGGLWELPAGTPLPEEDQSTTCIRLMKENLNLEITGPTYIASVRHAYSHFKLQMDIMICDWQNGAVRLDGPDAYQWIDPCRISGLPVHRAVLKAWPRMLEGLKSTAIP